MSDTQIGIITEVTSTTMVKVKMGASTIGTPATKLASYSSPAVNDRVLVATPLQGDRVVIGKIG